MYVYTSCARLSHGCVHVPSVMLLTPRALAHHAAQTWVLLCCHSHAHVNRAAATAIHHRRTRHPQTCTGTGGPCCPCRQARTACEQQRQRRQRHRLGVPGVTTPHRAAGQGEQERQATPCASQESRHLLVYSPSVRRPTSCSTAAPAQTSVGALVPTCQQFPQGAEEVQPVKGRRSVVSRAVSQRWTVQGNPGVLVRCTEQCTTARLCLCLLSDSQ
jgi:hypothetical protein